MFATPEIRASTINWKPPTKQHHGFTLKSAKQSFLDPAAKIKIDRSA